MNDLRGGGAHAPAPFELWEQAAGDTDRYLALLREHGHLVPVEPCPECGEAWRHAHADGAVVPLDAFGHPLR